MSMIDRVDGILNGLSRERWSGPSTFRAMLIPSSVKHPPREVNIQAIDQGDDHVLRSSAMTVLSDEPGCEHYKVLRQVTSISRGDSLDGGYAGLLDCHREYVSHKAGLAMMFLGAENGYPPAVSLFRELPPNEHLGGAVRGPVLVYVSRWIEVAYGGKEVQVLQWSALLDLADVFELARAGVTSRLHGAGLRKESLHSD